MDVSGGPAVIFSQPEQASDGPHGRDASAHTKRAGPSGQGKQKYASPNTNRPLPQAGGPSALGTVNEELIEADVEGGHTISNILNQHTSPPDDYPSQPPPNPQGKSPDYETPVSGAIGQACMDELKDAAVENNNQPKRYTYMHPEKGEDNHSYEGIKES